MKNPGVLGESNGRGEPPMKQPTESSAVPKLAYQLMGDGVPIVCIHAPCIGSINFIYQQSLSDCFQLLLPDLPGHGDSPPLHASTTMEDLAEQLHELIRSAGIERPVLLGYSEGASLVLEYCLRYSSEVEKAILVSAFPEVNTMYLHGLFYLGESVAAFHGVPLLAKSIASSHVTDPAVRERWVQHALRSDAESLKRHYAVGHQYRCTERLHELQIPVLLVYGKQDKQLLPYARLLDAHLPNAELAFVPGVRHQVITKGAAAFNQLCRDFLQ